MKIGQRVYIPKLVLSDGTPSWIEMEYVGRDLTDINNPPYIHRHHFVEVSRYYGCELWTPDIERTIREGNMKLKDFKPTMSIKKLELL